MKIFSIKNLFTKGIQEYDEKDFIFTSCSGSVTEKNKECFHFIYATPKTYVSNYSLIYQLWIKHTAFFTKEEAIVAANKMKERKIKTLKKQLKKIEEMEFK